MTENIKDKLRKLEPGDTVEIITKGGDTFFARFGFDGRFGQFMFYDGHRLLRYQLSGKSSGTKHSSESSAIVDIRTIEPRRELQFLNNNKELFKKAEGK